MVLHISVGLFVWFLDMILHLRVTRSAEKLSDLSGTSRDLGFWARINFNGLNAVTSQGLDVLKCEFESNKVAIIMSTLIYAYTPMELLLE